jgi:aryl-alcohol dehydrogenase-like predicted oxidoreductase
MKYRHLGRSGLCVSEIAYGNWITHGSQISEDNAISCVHSALDAGVTTFDTADVYATGRAEEILGRALSGQRRDSIEIFTKTYYPMYTTGRHNSGLSRKHILESVNGSLKRLATDYVDVYFAHRYDVETPLEETVSAFSDVIRSGKALYMGVSEWTLEQISACAPLAKDLGIQLIANQPQYSMLWRVIENDLMLGCRDLGISQAVWSPLAQGVLTGKYGLGDAIPPGSRAADQAVGAAMIKRWLRNDVLVAVEELRSVADDLGTTLSQLAIAWVLQSSDVATAIVGGTTPEQVAETVLASDIRIPGAAISRIDEILADVIYRDGGLIALQTPARRPDLRPFTQKPPIRIVITPSALIRSNRTSAASCVAFTEASWSGTARERRSRAVAACPPVIFSSVR